MPRRSGQTLEEGNYSELSRPFQRPVCLPLPLSQAIAGAFHLFMSKTGRTTKQPGVTPALTGGKLAPLASAAIRGSGPAWMESACLRAGLSLYLEAEFADPTGYTGGWLVGGASCVAQTKVTRPLL